MNIFIYRERKTHTYIYIYIYLTLVIALVECANHVQVGELMNIRTYCIDPHLLS